MSSYKRWTEEEEQRLRNIYPYWNDNKLEDEFERSKESIRRKASRLDLEKAPKYYMLKSIRRGEWIELEEIEDSTGDFISGFVAGEGCFSSCDNGNGGRVFTFTVELAEDDRNVLVEMKNILGCGSINEYDKRRETEKGSVIYQVKSFGDIYKRVIPFFNEYDLSPTRKEDQFDRWSEEFTSLVEDEALNKIRV